MDGRDRGPEAERFLYEAVTLPGKYDLDRPRLTTEQGDWFGKVDWYFQRNIDPATGLRPPGVAYAGSRFLDRKEYDGRFLTLRDRPGKVHGSEYTTWLDRTAQPATGYWFYLVVWPSQWAVIDMLDWRVQEPRLPVDIKHVDPETPFRRYQIGALKIIASDFVDF